MKKVKEEKRVYGSYYIRESMKNALAEIVTRKNYEVAGKYTMNDAIADAVHDYIVKNTTAGKTAGEGK